MGFWEHAFDSFGDNVALLNAAAGDVIDNANPFSDQFASGNAHNTAAEVERQRALEQGREFDPDKVAASEGGGLGTIVQAVTDTGHDVGAAVGHTVAEAGKAAGGALDALTNPWVLGGLAAVVVLVLVAPYAVPAIKAVA